MLTGGPVQVHRLTFDGSSAKVTTNTVTVNATATVYSDPIKLTEVGGTFSLYVKATSSVGSADVEIGYQGAPFVKDSLSYFMEDGNHAFKAPKGTSTDTISAQENGEDWALISFAPEVMPYIRISCTGISSNPADTVFEGYLMMNS